MKTLSQSLSSLIVEYHRLYAEFKRPEYLEMAAILGKIPGPDFQELWEAKVNAGCIREGLPLRYPQAIPTITTNPNVE